MMGQRHFILQTLSSFKTGGVFTSRQHHLGSSQEPPVPCRHLLPHHGTEVTPRTMAAGGRATGSALGIFQMWVLHKPRSEEKE